MFMKDCLFCDIINGSVSSYTLYEDDMVKVFLDAYPDSPGHTLIIPKKHFTELEDIEIDYLTHIMEIAKKVKKAMIENLNPDSVILIQNNGEAQFVKHYHLHLIPKYKRKVELSREEIFDLMRDKIK